MFQIVLFSDLQTVFDQFYSYFS